MAARSPGFDLARPAGDCGNADAAFLHAALGSTEWASAIEERQALAAFGRWPVVAAEDDQGILAQLQLVQQIEDATDVAVHARDHPGIGGVGMALATVASLVLAAIGTAASVSLALDFGLLRPVQLEVGSHGVLRNRQLGVRDGEGKVEEEWVVPVVPDELEALLGELVVAVGSLALNVLAVDSQVVVVRVEYFLVVPP